MNSVAQAGPDFGRAIPSETIEAGLRELNPDINFDVAVRKPDEFGYTLTMDPNKRRATEAGRVPVCHRDRYICSMDRGMVPEFKLWSVIKVPTEVDWWEADSEGATIQYETIPTVDPKYSEMLLEAENGQTNGLKIMDDGRLARLKVIVIKKARGRVVRVGWRFTLNCLVAAKIPSITAATLSMKFGVDMLKYPVGPPEEVQAALTEE